MWKVKAAAHFLSGLLNQSQFFVFSTAFNYSSYLCGDYFCKMMKLQKMKLKPNCSKMLVENVKCNPKLVLVYTPDWTSNGGKLPAGCWRT